MLVLDAFLVHQSSPCKNPQSTKRHSGSLCSGQPFLVHHPPPGIQAACAQGSPGSPSLFTNAPRLSPSPPLPLSPSLSLSLYGIHSPCAGSTTHSLARAAPPSSCRSQRCSRRPPPSSLSLSPSLSISLSISRSCEGPLRLWFRALWKQSQFGYLLSCLLCHFGTLVLWS